MLTPDELKKSSAGRKPFDAIVLFALHGRRVGLDLAESELGVLTSQCLDRRIPNKQILIDEIAAWEHDRNANHTKADWQFTTKNARIKLKHLYPAI